MILLLSAGGRWLAAVNVMVVRWRRRLSGPRFVRFLSVRHVDMAICAELTVVKDAGRPRAHLAKEATGPVPGHADGNIGRIPEAKTVPR
jgi:hypothetical protein